MMTQALESYLAVQRSAGFKLKKVEYYLRRFVQFSSNEGQAYISAQTVIEWARRGTSPAERSFRLKTAVCFARYLSAEDPRHEVPPDDVFGGYQIRRRIPFIFTVADVNRLVEPLRCKGRQALYGATPTALFLLCCRSQA